MKTDDFQNDIVENKDAVSSSDKNKKRMMMQKKWCNKNSAVVLENNKGFRNANNSDKNIKNSVKLLT